MMFAILLAQAAAPSDTSISFGPIFAFAEPYIVAILGTVITWMIGNAVAAFQRWTGMKIDASHREALQTAATNAVAAELSKLQVPANNLTIDTKNRVVAASIVALEQRVPDALKHFGLTPDRIGDIVEAKLGLLSNATAAPATVIPPMPVNNP